MKCLCACILSVGLGIAAFDFPNEGAMANVFEKFDVQAAFANHELFLSFRNAMDNGLRDRVFLKGYEGGDRFIPLLKEMIKESGIPPEFLYLALVESNFSPNAKSSKKAMGIWQFMPKTAKMLGLRVDSHMDERLDPVRSTQAAIEYLKQLHATFGKWYLAAIAYNCGEGRLGRAIDEAGSDDIEILLDENNPYIPLESRNYIRKILYVSMLLHNVDALKESSYEYLLNRGIGSPTIATIELNGVRTLAQIAKSAGMSLAELRHYNPHIKRMQIPRDGRRYLVHIPYENLSTYRSNEFERMYGKSTATEPRFVGTYPIGNQPTRMRFQWETQK
ncbi:MAG: lytic transglycosylase domain-containing protein [Helicobacter sp.]|nr:lytic transglycosylase domain-containing protein [Helicobacter sp.]